MVSCSSPLSQVHGVDDDNVEEVPPGSPATSGQSCGDEGDYKEKRMQEKCGRVPVIQNDPSVVESSLREVWYSGEVVIHHVRHPALLIC